jgi:hypothetical protein
MAAGVVRYPRYRFPAAIICHAGWRYYRATQTRTRAATLTPR